MADAIWPSRGQSKLDQLNVAFLEAMNEIGRYGQSVYGPLPRIRAEHSSPERVTTEEIADHALNHFLAYLAREPHDHFRTRKHQLAAVAFNAMMEFQFAGLESEECMCGRCPNCDGRARDAAGITLSTPLGQYIPVERQAVAQLKPGCVHFYNRSRGVCIYCDGAMPQ